MGVRFLRQADLAQVAELHRRVTGSGPKTPEIDAAYDTWFAEAFFRDPMSAAVESVGPLVHVGERGVIDGFLGVSARRMRLGKRTYLAALSSQFIVDPEARSTLVAFQLMRSFLTGPQDLSMADEANEKSARMWRVLGGVSSHLYGTSWIRPLRPLSLLAALGAQRAPGFAVARAATNIVTRAIDDLVIRIPGPQRPVAPEDIRAEPLAPEAFIELSPRFAERDALLPDHDVASLRWTLSRARGPGRGAPFECSLVRDGTGEPLGLYVTTMPAGGHAQVLHLAASPRAQEPVIRYLVSRAFRCGALSLSGRVQPSLMRALSRSFALFHKRGPHLLLHARRPELLTAFDRGVAVFSRLEGEWCIRFIPPEPVKRRRVGLVSLPATPSAPAQLSPHPTPSYLGSRG